MSGDTSSSLALRRQQERKKWEEQRKLQIATGDRRYKVNHVEL
jgi:hypothetical protein